MALKWCTKLDVVWKRCPIDFEGHSLNFWVTQDKNRQFWPELKILFEFTDGYEMMHKARCCIEEVPYCFSRSPIKFQRHIGRKIEDLNPIWVRLLGQLQLSNPSDLPCSFKKMHLTMSSAKWQRFYPHQCIDNSNMMHTSHSWLKINNGLRLRVRVRKIW